MLDNRPLLELSNYHVLGRLFYYVPSCAIISPARVLRYFGLVMILVETINALGVSLTANSSSSASQQSIGGALTITALVMQFLIIIVFFCIAVLFHRRRTQNSLLIKNVRVMLYILCLSMILILVRCIYRLIEHTGNTHIDINDVESMKKLSPLLRYEAFFYVFEAALMLINSVVWNIWHAGRYLPQHQHTYLSLNGTEKHAEVSIDERSLLAKTINILTFGLVYPKKDVVKVPIARDEIQLVSLSADSSQ